MHRGGRRRAGSGVRQLVIKELRVSVQQPTARPASELWPGSAAMRRGQAQRHEASGVGRSVRARRARDAAQHTHGPGVVGGAFVSGAWGRSSVGVSAMVSVKRGAGEAVGAGIARPGAPCTHAKSVRWVSSGPGWWWWGGELDTGRWRQGGALAGGACLRQRCVPGRAFERGLSRGLCSAAAEGLIAGRGRGARATQESHEWWKGPRGGAQKGSA